MVLRIRSTIYIYLILALLVLPLIADSDDGYELDQEGYLEVELSNSLTFQYEQTQLTSFYFTNKNRLTKVEFTIEFLLDNLEQIRYDSQSFLLIGSSKQISSNQFLQNFIIGSFETDQFITEFQVFAYDVDGLATRKKVLSVRYEENSSSRARLLKSQPPNPSPVPQPYPMPPISNSPEILYFYLLGPYEFGAKQPALVPKNPSIDQLYIQGKATVASEFKCQSDCFSNQQHGSCVRVSPSESYCDCKSNFVNRDCGNTAREVRINKGSVFFNMQAGYIQRLYIDFENNDNKIDDPLLLSAQTKTKDTQIEMFSVSAEKGGSQGQVPDYLLWIRMQYPNSSEAIVSNQMKTYAIPASDVQSYIQTKSQLIILLVGYENTSFEINFYTDDGFNMSAMVILFIVIGVLILLIIAYSIWVLCFRKKLATVRSGSGSQSRENSNQIQRGVYDLGVGGVAAAAAAGGNRQNVPLSLEQMNEYMPCRNYDKQSISGEACAVCLEDFVNGVDSVRMTICSHFFHDDCLQQWMKKQQNCPFCRQELSLFHLQNFKRNPVQYPSIQTIQVKPNIRNKELNAISQRSNQDEPNQPFIGDIKKDLGDNLGQNQL